MDGADKPFDGGGAKKRFVMEVIAWDKLSDYIGKQLPAVIPIAGKRKLSIAVGKGARTLSLRIPHEGKDAGLASPYRELTYEITTVDGKRVLELATSAPELFHGFYLFAVLVAEHIEERGEEVLNAIRRAQQTFGQLLFKRSLLSEEKQTGLMGELCLLRGVLRRWGKAGFSSWVGPAGERHDFRIDDVEIEVKSTTSTIRKHHINGAGQLEPSPGKTLYLLSFQFELAGMGSGQTLPGSVETVRDLLRTDVEQKASFDQFLKTLGYHDADAELYVQSYQLRSRPVLVPVDKECPKITGDELRKAVAPALLARVSAVEYVVDVSGLGFPEGSKRFAEVLRNLPPLE